VEFDYVALYRDNVDWWVDNIRKNIVYADKGSKIDIREWQHFQDVDGDKFWRDLVLAVVFGVERIAFDESGYPHYSMRGFYEHYGRLPERSDKLVVESWGFSIRGGVTLDYYNGWFRTVWK